MVPIVLVFEQLFNLYMYACELSYGDPSILEYTDVYAHVKVSIFGGLSNFTKSQSTVCTCVETG